MREKCRKVCITIPCVHLQLFHKFSKFVSRIVYVRGHLILLHILYYYYISPYIIIYLIYYYIYFSVHYKSHERSETLFTKGLIQGLIFVNKKVKCSI